MHTRLHARLHVHSRVLPRAVDAGLSRDRRDLLRAVGERFQQRPLWSTAELAEECCSVPQGDPNDPQGIAAHPGNQSVPRGGELELVLPRVAFIFRNGGQGSLCSA